MDRSDLRSFADRARALTDSSPPMSTTETRSWLVEPLLETLGWDPRAASCRTDVRVADVRLEYLLLAASTPAMFVAVESYTTPLEADRARRLRAAMARTGVDRAIYTNGQRVALVAGPAGEDHLECPLMSIHDYDDALGHFSRPAAEGRLERHARRLTARRLAVDRSALASTIATELATVAGEHYQAEFERAGARFVDDLVETLTEDTTDYSDEHEHPLQSDESASVANSEAPAETPLEDAADRSVDGTREQPARSTPNAQSIDSDANRSDDECDDGGREYVVRFFGERGSIGGVGHSSPTEATVHAAEFLFERGLSGVSPPWGPDGEATVLNDEPTLANGSPMPEARELSNGLYLNAAGSVDDLAARVVAMAERAGLRAMLTGDWSLEPASAE